MQFTKCVYRVRWTVPFDLPTIEGEPGILGDRQLQHGDAVFRGSGMLADLKWLHSSRHKQNLLELEYVGGSLCNDEMSNMNGIERPTKHPESHYVLAGRRIAHAAWCVHNGFRIVPLELEAHILFVLLISNPLVRLDQTQESLWCK